MTEIAKVTVAKDALSSLQESINIGKEVLQRKLSKMGTFVQNVHYMYLSVPFSAFPFMCDW